MTKPDGLSGHWPADTINDIAAAGAAGAEGGAMAMNRRWWLALAVPAVMSLCVAADNGAAPHRFSTEAWQRAATSGAQDWSREAMLKSLPADAIRPGMSRAQIVALLGPPGYANADYRLGVGVTSRIDVYRLSGRNDRSYRIDYDGQDRLIMHAIDESPCDCDLCTDRAPAVPFAAVDRAVLNKTALREGTQLTIGQLESRIGRPGQRIVDRGVSGGQMWVNYVDIWRVTGGEPHYLFASGHRPARDWKFGALDNEPLDSYDLVTMFPQCLAR